MSNRIKKLRLEKKISQQKLADEIGVTRQAISLFEKGERDPKLETWIKLADYFNVPVGYLQGVEEKNRIYHFSFVDVSDKLKKCFSEEEQKELIDLETNISNVYASNRENQIIKTKFTKELKDLIEKYSDTDKTNYEASLEEFVAKLKKDDQDTES